MKNDQENQRAEATENLDRTVKSSEKMTVEEYGIKPCFVDPENLEQQKREQAKKKSSKFLLIGIVAFLLVGTISIILVFQYSKNTTEMSENKNLDIDIQLHETKNKVKASENADLDKSFARQVALVEESRELLGPQAKTLDSLVDKLYQSTSQEEKLRFAKRINAGLHEVVFFAAPIGDANAAGILEENTNLDTIFFFAKP